MTRTAIAIWRLDRGKMLEVNEAWLELFHYDREDVLALDQSRVWLNPSDLTRVEKEILNRGFITDMDCTFVKKTGEQFVSRFSAEILTIDDKKCVLSTWSDSKSEKSISESEERLRALMSNNPSLIFMKDEHGRYVYLNKAYEKQFVGAKDWYGKTDFDFWPLESAELFQANDADVIKSGTVQQFFEDSTDLQGNRYCWLCYKFPFTDSKGRLYVGGIGIDATERKLAEERLRESEGRYFQLVQNTTAIILRLDVQGRITFINNHAQKFFGYSSEEILGRPALGTIVPEKETTGRDLADMVEKIIANPDDFHTNSNENIKKTGERVWVEWTNSAIHDSKGQLCGFLSVGIDRTEQKRWHEALLQSRDNLETKVKERTGQLLEANKALRQSEEKYRELVECAQSIILRMDNKGNITFFNEFSERFFGYSRQEILGRNVVGTIVPETESSGRDLNVLLKDISQNPEKYANNENENIRKNGERVWITWTNAPVLDAQGAVAEVLCIGNDITERKRIEERLRLAQRNLRAMVSEVVIAEERSREHFATDLHDTVVQMLGAAKLRAQLIQDLIPRKAKAVYAELQDILSESIREARSIMAELSPPVLSELGLISALEWLTEQTGNKHNIKVNFRSNNHDRAIALPREIEVLLFQITRELLMNIVKHAQAQSATVRFSSNDQKLTIEVSDNGRGFDMKKTFEPDLKGGYGLYSIRERLRHIGGVLAIKSEPGQGTTVLITAPRELIK